MPSIAAARFSIFAWPYGCDASAGSAALRSEKNAITDASRSIDECAASVRIATEPVMTPATILSAIRMEFEPIEIAAARVLRRSFVTSATPATRGTRARHGHDG